MTVCIINALSALKLADHSCSHVQNGLSFICPCVDRGTNTGYIWGLGGLTSVATPEVCWGCSTSLLGAGFVPSGPSGMVLPAVSGLPLVQGMKLAAEWGCGGEPSERRMQEQGRGPELTPSGRGR